MQGVLGVCGGNGVILHPLRNSKILGNIEPRSVFHTKDNVQWRLNFRAPFENDLSSRYAGVNVIVGAPDCGHSSVLSYSRAKKLSNPKDNDSLRMYIRALKIYKPKMFLMENLSKMLEAYPTLIPFLEKKYRVIQYKQSVSFWGNSQVSRVRLVLVGIRKDQDLDLIYKVISEESSREYQLKTSGELISGIDPEKTTGHIREPDDYEIPLYYQGKRKLTTLEAKNIWNTVYNGKTRWEVNMDKMKCQPGVYRNLENEYPKTARKQNRQFNHLGEMLTPRELARIQGVPDNFKLNFEEDNLLYWINKGRVTVTKTPPYEIGVWFNRILTRI